MATDTTEAQAAEIEVQEYGSITITIDHLNREPRGDGKVVTKVVYSTESAHESIVAQVAYFYEKGLAQNILGDKDIFATIASGLDRDVAYVYTPGEFQTNIIVDAALYHKMTTNPLTNPDQTVLGLHAGLVALATDMMRAAKAEGKDPTVVVFVPTGL